MSDEFRNAVISIADRAGQHLGSGFVVHRDPRGTYVVTSTHTLGKIGSVAEAVVAADASLVPYLASSSVMYDVDLAVLRVAGLYDRPLLRLAPLCDLHQDLSILGYRCPPSGPATLRSKPASLGALIGRADSRRTAPRTWELLLRSDTRLEASYSGAPIITPGDQSVRAVVTCHRTNPAGQALAIEALRLVWPDMPRNLLQLPASEPDQAFVATGYAGGGHPPQAGASRPADAQAGSNQGSGSGAGQSGDTIAGDKILGDKVLGDKQVFHNHVSTVGGSITLTNSVVAGDVVCGTQTNYITPTPPKQSE